MVNFCSLNIRGVNKKPKQASVQDLICKKSISFVGLVETRVKAHKASNVASAINKKWKWLFHYEHHLNGRIWFGWDPNIWDVSFVSNSSQYIHYLVMSIELKVQFFFTVIYGLNSPGERSTLWKDLRLLAASSDKLWCILGDFNEVLSVT